MLTDTITVNEVIPGGPSEKVGLLPGDRIMTINDSLVAGHNIPNTDIVKMLRGEKGSSVKLGVKRKNTKKTLTFEVTRGDIPVNSVDASYMITPETGYIKVNKFGRTTSDESVSYTHLINAPLSSTSPSDTSMILFDSSGAGFILTLR